ncbi:MAG: hypothetical protein WCT22_00245 [Patescibacteria group bacterium]|jgi:hypothetical protein
MVEGAVVPTQARASVAVAERLRSVVVVEAKPVTEAKPNVEPASAAFEREAQEHFKKLNPREAIAGIAGWGIMGRVDTQIIQMTQEVFDLQKNGLITEEKALDFSKRIGRLSSRVREEVIPRIQKSGEIASAEEKAGEVDPILRDLNFHTIKADIKALEARNDPKDKQALDELRGDLVKAEKERQGLDPKNDEVIKLALKLTGTKELPAKFKDTPLEAIGDFFNHQNLRAILKSDSKAASLAQRMELSVGELRELVRTYDLGKGMEAEMKKLNDEIIISDPEKGKGLRRKGIVKAGATISMILTALSGYAMFGAVKKDGSGPQG